MMQLKTRNVMIFLLACVMIFQIFTSETGNVVLAVTTTLDNCNSVTGWTGSDAVSLDTTNMREGTGCLTKTGTGIDWFKKTFSTPVNSGVTEANGYLHIWIYVSDVTKFSADGQIEITSSGGPDVNEYAWLGSSLSLVNGWNERYLKISSAIKTGTPNLSAINFFRIYRPFSASVTCKIDDLKFTDTLSGATPTPTTTPTPTATSTPAQSPTPTSGGIPDLIVTDISWTPASPNAGNAVTFSATVKNQGAGATPGGVVMGIGFYLDGSASAFVWSDNYTTSLAAGASVTITVNGGASGPTWTATSGSHTVRAWVDDVNRIAESNETNNQYTESLTVGGGATPTPTTTVSSGPTNTPSGVIKNIHLSWKQNNTASTLTVTWTTTGNTASTVKYGLTSSYGSQVTGTTTNSSALGTYVHTAEITGLSANTTYHYSCGSATDGYSPDYTFTTAPIKGSSTSFTVGLWSDTQNDAGSSNASFAITSTVANRMRTFNPRFTIHSGDMVVSGATASNWLNFFGATVNLNAAAPFMPATGNHDNTANTTLPANFYDVFNLPNNEANYSFDYGNAHFVCVNTGRANDVAENQTVFYQGTAQYNWLQSDLQAASNDANIKWIIVYFHYPPYSYGVSESLAVRNQLCPLFDQYGVDLVFTGHRHVYERMKSINNTQIIQTGPNYTKPPAATLYITIGTGGGNAQGAGSTNYAAYSNATPYAFGILNINGNTLNYQAVHETGTVYDQCAITK